ncbi:MAG: VOC family protein [Phycicoccus sp.]
MDDTTATTPAATPTASITVTNCFVSVDDHEAALGFYRDVLGFAVVDDVAMGDLRWVTVTAPAQPELRVVIQSAAPDPTISDADRAALDSLLAKGLLPGVTLGCTDVDALFEHVRASGAEVLQEPTDQFYGVRDCAFRDPAGNMIRFNQPLSPADGDPTAAAE